MYEAGEGGVFVEEEACGGWGAVNGSEVPPVVEALEVVWVDRGVPVWTWVRRWV